MFLVFRSVQLDQQGIDLQLLQRIFPDQLLRDLVIHVTYRLLYTQSEITLPSVS